MSKLLASKYNPSSFEAKISENWSRDNVFIPHQQPVESFTIVIPPPNVTGVLHMGHGLNTALQDILIRYERMQGKRTLWVPGADHAGIATQHVVSERLRAKGISPQKIGRESFLSHTWAVKEEHHEVIRAQLKSLGASLDWSRERFTLDEGLSKAVREVFVRLFEEDLIYRGEYLVNWCPSCRTALSDDEVEHQEESGFLYRLLYPFVDADDRLSLSDRNDPTIEAIEYSGIVVATTRPETLFGDQAIAVHPDDPRYQALLGKRVYIPISRRMIPIIADRHCEIGFGSGAVKVTPAHDPDDWQIGQRHQLSVCNILNTDGSLNEEVPQIFQGQKGKEARNSVLDALRVEGLLLESAAHRHSVGHCYRCNTVIEPYLSKQWFVRMEPLAKKALASLDAGDLHFYPDRWKNVYRHWMVNIKDWCISRQLWWGHRIPGWFCHDCGEVSVSREDLLQCSHCNSDHIFQDEDVLDTWFSSWIWPFSSLGWPDKTADLERFYPTSSLVTGYDIIFFWVARMVMAGLHFTGKVPFRDVFITPLIRDKQGRKMSKSLGNGIDPLEVIESYGADALKFTVAFLSSQGQDLSLNLDSFKLGSRFCNKIWNAVRFVLMRLDQLAEDTQVSIGDLFLELADCSYSSSELWIWHHFYTTVDEIEQARAQYRFDDMSHACYNFFWNHFCDWYLEVVKMELNQSAVLRERQLAAVRLIELLEACLRLLHPFVSFLTEELYSYLPETCRFPKLVNAPYPKSSEKNSIKMSALSPMLLGNFDHLQSCIVRVRTIRSEFALSPAEVIPIALEGLSLGLSCFVQEQAHWIEGLCKARLIGPEDPSYRGENSIVCSLVEGEVRLFIKEWIHIEKERLRLEKLLEKEKKYILSLQSKLSNAKFIERAPDALVAEERQKLDRVALSLARNQQLFAQL